jgi:predicted transcriptional regulator
MHATSEVMTREAETITPEASVQDAARLMSELNVGSLPVCDGNTRVDMVTDRDITLRDGNGQGAAEHRGGRSDDRSGDLLQRKRLRRRRAADDG